MRTLARKQSRIQRKSLTKSKRRGQTHDTKHPILCLQRTIGNQGVQRLLHTNTKRLGLGSDDLAITRFTHDLSRILVHGKTPEKIQTKQTVNNRGDIYEREAERCAEQVMLAPKTRIQRACYYSGGYSQGKIKQPKQDRLQTTHFRTCNARENIVPPMVHEVLRSPGQALDSDTRIFMESHFAHDFSQVRIHNDAKADLAVRAFGAHAFTLGNDLFFRSHEYGAGTRSTRRLLAHELCHVVQQRTRGAAPMILRKPDNLERPASVIHPCIDVRAQFALQRLFRGPEDDARDAILLFRAVDSGQIIGIFGDDLGISARMATDRMTKRWKLVPNGQDSVLLNDASPDTPAIIFRESAGQHPRLDRTLLQVYRRNRGTLGPIPEGKSPPKCQVTPLPKKEKPPKKQTPPAPKLPSMPAPIPPVIRPLPTCSNFYLRDAGMVTMLGNKSNISHSVFRGGPNVSVMLTLGPPPPSLVPGFEFIALVYVRLARPGYVGPTVSLTQFKPIELVNFSRKQCVRDDPARPGLDNWSIEISGKAEFFFFPSPSSVPSIPAPGAVSWLISSDWRPGERPCCP